MKVLVTGAAGQLGAVIVRHCSADADVVALTRAELDLADTPAVRAAVAATRPAVVINCAAYNQVDAAETDAQTALTVNALAVRALARAAAEAGAAFVHYGTDFVFDGRAARPYTEEDPPNPRSVYAASKLVGEWFAADAPRHYVLRVESLFGGASRKSSTDKIIDQLASGEEARVFVDRTVSPSYVEDVARATRALLAREAPSGVYHCVNSGLCTWHELGAEIARLLDVPARLVPVRVADVRLPAERPQYCALSNAKLAALGIEMPSWQDALARHIARRRSENR
jgi:dTDP-4-dehydrorhamnose reductase